MTITIAIPVGILEQSNQLETRILKKPVGGARDEFENERLQRSKALGKTADSRVLCRSRPSKIQAQPTEKTKQVALRMPRSTTEV